MNERFWSKVDRRGSDECWPWLGGSVDKDGYGVFFRSEPRGNVRAHRMAWQIHHGHPGAKLVLHKCDNRACVNPAHLFLGTHQDNQADKVAKRRQARGERQGNARMTADIVRELRSMDGTGLSQRAMGEKYGLRQAQVSRILLRQSWKHIE